MPSLLTFVLSSYLVLYAFANILSPVSVLSHFQLLDKIQPNESIKPRESLLEAWLNTEYDVALNRLLDNVAPGGGNALGATPGTVIASPSRSHPNYYYQCNELPSSTRL